MTSSLDLNADIGELTDADGARCEQAILDFVSSCNIACGGHAGDAQSMRERVRYAHMKSVTIGAHPAYPDRVNFGRKSMRLGIDITQSALRAALTSQIKTLIDIAKDEGASVAYVKPHGTLYTDAADNDILADLIAGVIADIDPDLGMMGFPSSALARAAGRFNLTFLPEAFIDRLYAPGGFLTPRSHPRAVISDIDARLAQALSLALDNIAHDENGLAVSVKAGSLCLHGDSDGSVETARLTREVLEAAGITIQSPYAGPAKARM